jgi:hypothetical protein
VAFWSIGHPEPAEGASEDQPEDPGSDKKMILPSMCKNQERIDINLSLSSLYMGVLGYCQISTDSLLVVLSFEMGSICHFYMR